MRTIEIDGRRIGSGEPCFIIAEAGVNHNGDIRIAKQLVDAAAAAGADAVKFQSFTAEKVVSHFAPKADYQLQSTDREESQFEMLKKLELSGEMQKELFTYSMARDILFLSTPFDEDNVDFLHALGVKAFKIGSGEITNHPLLVHIARKQKPIILSTGMSSLIDVGQAIEQIHGEGNSQLALLHCVSTYPTEPRDVNLKAMITLNNAYQLPVGYSDHTEGIEVAIAAVALGATIIEKHFTLDRMMPGPDHRASIEPETLRMLVSGIRKVESAMGHGRKEPAKCEANTAAVARRSLVASRDLYVGEVLTEDDILIRRPGTGLPPSMKSFLIGLTLKEDVAAGELITREVIR